MDSDPEELFDSPLRCGTPLTSDDEMMILSKIPGTRKTQISPSPAPLWGRRRQRRFENDLLFWDLPSSRSFWENSPTMMHLHMFDNETNAIHEAFGATMAFDRLKEHPELLERFLNGEQQLVVGVKRRVREKRPLDRVDKKIRSHLRTERAIRFVKVLESVLWGQQGEEERITINEDLCCQRVWDETSGEEVVSIALHSPFHRMLAHGLAQFHDIPVQSSEQSKMFLEFRGAFVQQPPAQRLTSYLQMYMVV